MARRRLRDSAVIVAIAVACLAACGGGDLPTYPEQSAHLASLRSDPIFAVAPPGSSWIESGADGPTSCSDDLDHNEPYLVRHVTRPADDPTGAKTMKFFTDRALASGWRGEQSGSDSSESISRTGTSGLKEVMTVDANGGPTQAVSVSLRMTGFAFCSPTPTDRHSS